MEDVFLSLSVLVLVALGELGVLLISVVELDVPLAVHDGGLVGVFLSTDLAMSCVASDPALDSAQGPWVVELHVDVDVLPTSLRASFSSRDSIEG